MPDPLDNIQLKKPPPPMASTFNWVVIQLANLIDNFSAPVMTVSLKRKTMFQIALGCVILIPRSFLDRNVFQLLLLTHLHRFL